MLRGFQLLTTRRFWQRAAFFTVAGLSLIALALLIIDFHGRAAWAEYKKSAANRGLKLDFRDYVPAEIPDEANFGAASVFKRAVSPNAAERAAVTKELELPFRNYGFLSMPLDFARIQEEFVKAGWLTEPLDNPVEGTLRALDRFEPVLAELREALDRPGTRLVGRWDPPLEADLFKNYSIYSLSHILGLRVAALLYADRSAEAFIDWRVKMRLANLLQGQPTMLGGFLRMAMVSFAVSDADIGISMHRWNDAELGEIERLLGQVDLVEDFRHTIASERTFTGEALTALRANPSATRFGSPAGDWFSDFIYRFAPRGWYDANRLRFNQWCDAYADAFEDPANDLSVLRSLEKPTHQGLGKYYWGPFRLIIFHTGWRDWPEWFRTTQGGVALARVAAGLERYRLRHGNYPAELTALVRAELAALPTNQWSEPIARYRALPNNEFSLYHVGINRQDDGQTGDDVAWPPFERR
jgi:hypothetical protein